MISHVLPDNNRYAVAGRTRWISVAVLGLMLMAVWLRAPTGAAAAPVGPGCAELVASARAGALVPSARAVGVSDPDETLTLRPGQVHVGDIYLYNNSRLVVDGSSRGASVAGNIHLLDRSALLVTGSSFDVAQQYSQQFHILAGDDSRIEIAGSRVTVGRQPDTMFVMVMCGRSVLTIRGSDFTGPGVGMIDIFTQDGARVRLEGSDGVFELNMGPGGHADVRDVVHGGVGVYFTVDGPVAEPITLAGGQSVSRNVRFTSGTRAEQSADIRDSNVIFGLWVDPGADLTLTNSEVALLLRLRGAVNLSGLEAGTFQNRTIALADRTLRLLNTRVLTLNTYHEAGGDTEPVTIQGSRLGEHACSGQRGKRCLLSDSVVDGSGGTLGADGAAELVLERSRVTTAILASHQSVIRMRGSNVDPAPTGAAAASLVAADDAIIVLEDTQLHPSVPTSTVGRGAILTARLEAPSNGDVISGPVSVRGTAHVLADPSSQRAFSFYEVSVRRLADGVRTPIAQGNSSVSAGTLATWNPADFQPGDYELELAVTGKDGTRAQVTRRIQVAGTTVVPAPAPAPGPCQFQLGFAALRDLAGPSLVGDCVAPEEYHPVTGDALQRTTGGLLVWRKLDNWTAFTDGTRTWLNGPLGLQQRTNDERFDWEAEGV